MVGWEGMRAPGQRGIGKAGRADRGLSCVTAASVRGYFGFEVNIPKGCPYSSGIQVWGSTTRMDVPIRMVGLFLDGVAEPDGVAHALHVGQGQERRGIGVGLDAVEHRRHARAAVDAAAYHQADFVQQTGF